jgi:hypothetical protein
MFVFQDIEKTEFLIALKPFNMRRGFLVATCYNRLTRYTFREGEPGSASNSIEIPNDKIEAIAISDKDEYAVLIGAEQNLSVHVVDVRTGLGKTTKLELSKASKPINYAFDRNYDEASIVGRETLLISYHKGPSVHITLSPALDTCLGREG